MSDLIEELKNSAQWYDCDGCGKGAEEIERLTNACKSYETQANRDALELDRLREEVQMVRDHNVKIIAGYERELADMRTLLDQVERIAVNDKTGCRHCTAIVNQIVQATGR